MVDCSVAAQCNLTQPSPTSVPFSFCAYTGSTHTLIRASEAPYINHAADPLNVLLPNGHTMHSIGTCLLQLPNLQYSLLAHIFPDTTLNSSLLSIPQLCKMGCTAMFTSTEVTILCNHLTVLSAVKPSTTHLWSICHPEQPFQHVVSVTNAATALSTDAAFVKFTHAALGSPALSTLNAAVRRGYLHSYPRLTPAI